MFRLDRTRDYAEVHDNGRMLFAQGGRVFTLSGDEVVAEGGLVEPDPNYVEAPVEASDQPPAPLLTALGEAAKVGADDMRLAANRALKSQMEAFQEPWQGVDHARKFLGLT